MKSLPLVALIGLLLLDVSRAEEYDAPEELREQLPDLSNTDIHNKVHCSACQATTEHLITSIAKLVELRMGTPKLTELHEALIDACDTIRDFYGLLLTPAKKVVPKFVSANNNYIMRGNWISGVITEHCTSAVNEFADEIIAEIQSGEKTLTHKLCEVWLTPCKGVKFDDTEESDL